MSNNDDYWSDSEEENELIQDSRDLPPIEMDSEDEEEYYEILKLVNSKIKYDDNNIYEDDKNTIVNNSNKKSKKNSKNNSKKQKKIYLDLNSLDESKKKVWKSKRMVNKKGPNIEKRKFNPRLPPPGKKFKNIKKKKDDIMLNLELDFPSL